MFENIHRNKKLAFLDGLLCGIAVCKTAQLFYQMHREETDRKKRAEEALKQKSSV